MGLKEMLGEELFNTVTEKLGDKKIIINDGSYLPIEKFNEKIEEIKILKEKVTQHETQITETKTLLEGSTELKAKYEELQTQSKTELEAKDKQILNIEKKTALAKSLQEKGARYPDLLIKQFDLDKLELESGKIKGFEDIVKPYTEQYKDMFEVIDLQGVDPGKGDKQNKPGDMDLSYFDTIK